ncbi:MAG TPA: LacI family DNA-binding transcriptional regulator [Terriglobales bacterium]|nr:LacI family DNA-binding transcriptional regulator [Terriglobales bacterium]
MNGSTGDDAAGFHAGEARTARVRRGTASERRKAGAAVTVAGRSSPERPAQATMHDVAAAAHVSLKTVSRVVNRESGVRPETQKRVEDAIASLGFRRNVAARSLRTGHRVVSIGLVVADLVNPFYSSVAKAVEAVAIRHNAVVIIGSSGENATRERELVINLLHRPVDGLIVVPAGGDHLYLEPERRLGAQVVFLDRSGGNIEADAVVLDNLGGAKRAVDHLIRRGHRRVGFVGDSATVRTAVDRLEGYKAALAEAGITYDPELVRLGSSAVEKAETAAGQLLALEDPATAIFAGNNRQCVGVLRAIRAAHRPTAVVGFDDFELADLLPIPVSVIAYDPAELGRAAAELLFSRMAGDARPPQRIVIPTRLIQRGSGEISA